MLHQDRQVLSMFDLLCGWGVHRRTEANRRVTKDGLGTQLNVLFHFIFIQQEHLSESAHFFFRLSDFTQVYAVILLE